MLVAEAGLLVMMVEAGRLLLPMVEVPADGAGVVAETVALISAVVVAVQRVVVVGQEVPAAVA
jgi:hypothetical protein